MNVAVLSSPTRFPFGACLQQDDLVGMLKTAGVASGIMNNQKHNTMQQYSMKQRQKLRTSDDRPFYGSDRALLQKLIACESQSCDYLEALQDRVSTAEAEIVSVELDRRRELLEWLTQQEKLAQQ